MGYASAIGAVVGALTSGWNIYEQKRQQSRENALAEKQYQATKTAYENEAQERAKANGKEADIDALLEANTTSSRAKTDLTGGKVKRGKLFNSSTTASSQLGVNGNGSGS